jgi:hypothetical protein
MGSTPSISTYFAVEAPRSIFYIPTGEHKRVCSTHVTEHLVGAHAKFCDECGAKTALQSLEAPTEAFAAFCVEREVNPEFAFHELHEDGWEWSDQAGTKHTLGWYRVQAWDTSELDSGSKCMALGIRLGWTSADSRDPKLLAYSIEDLTKLVEPLREIAQLFKIDEQPKLYAQLRWY